MGATYELFFKTTADVSAAVEVLRNLERQRAVAGALGEDFTKLDGKIAKLRGSLDEFGKASAQNSEIVKKAMNPLGAEDSANPLHGMHERTRLIRNELSLLGAQAPEVFHLLHVALNPALAGLGALLAITREVTAAVQEENEKFQKLITLSLQLPALADMGRAHAAAMRDASAATQEFLDHLATLAEQQPTIADAMSKSLDQIKSSADTWKEIASSQDQATLSLLKFAEHSGQVSSEQAAQLKLQLELRQRIDDHRQEEKTLGKERISILDARNLAMSESEAAKEDLPARQAAAATAKANFDALGKDIEKLTAALSSEQTTKALSEARTAMGQFADTRPEWMGLTPTQRLAMSRELQAKAAAEAGTQAANVPTSFTALSSQFDRFLQIALRAESLEHQFSRRQADLRVAEEGQPEAKRVWDQAQKDLEETQKRADQATEGITKSAEALKDLDARLAESVSKWQASFAALAVQKTAETFSGQGFPAGGNGQTQLVQAMRRAGASNEDVARAVELWAQATRMISIRMQEQQVAAQNTITRVNSQRIPGNN